MDKRQIVGALMAASLFGTHMSTLQAASCNVSTTGTNTTLSPSFMGRNKLMVGLSGSDASAASAPFDLRYRYFNSMPFSSYNHASCMLNVTAGCTGWWGGWQETGVPGGLYATRHIQSTQAATWQGAPQPQIPVFTYYMILPASGLQEGTTEVAAINDQTFLTTYFNDWRFLLQKIGNSQAMLHLEPDFWGFVRALDSNPANVPAKVNASNPVDCGSAAQYPDNAAGFAQCMIHMARVYAPHATVGIHAPGWTFSQPGDAQATVNFLLALGADKGDFIVNDPSDRDAGYYETVLNRPDAWWDDAKAATYLAWIKAVTDQLGKPAVLWQIPLGNSSGNNTPGQYKDNRVEYFFSHMGELRDANIVGLMFGAGEGQQTTPETDGGLLFCSATQDYVQGMGGPAPGIQSTLTLASGPTPSGAGVQATATQAGTGYWLLVPQSSPAPTSAQVEAGVNYGSVTVVAAGNLPLSANVAGSISLNGLNAGTRYTLYFAAKDTGNTLQATPTSLVVATTTTTYTGPAPGGGGNVDTVLTGGGTDCGFQSVTYQNINSVGAPPPPGVTFPYGVVNFTATGCTPGGDITVTLTYPHPLPADAKFWKYGPATAGAAPTWYQHPAVISGNTITYSVTDNGVGDNNNVLGQITDPAGPALAAAAAAQTIPTLSEWALALLAALMGASAGWVGLRRGMPGAPRQALKG